MFANLRISQPWGLADEDILKRSTEGSVVLKRCLLIFSDLICDSRVDPGMPSLPVPDSPDTLPSLSRRAASMISFSWAAGLRDSPRSLLGLVIWGCRESQLSSTGIVSPTRIHNQSFIRVGFQFRTVARNASIDKRITNETTRLKREYIAVPSTLDSPSLNFSYFV